MRTILSFCGTPIAALIVSLILAVAANGQAIGDDIVLNATSAQGVPVHATGTDSRYFRWPNGTTGTVKSIHPQSGWFEITTDGGIGWVTGKYVTVVESDEEETPENEIATATIGTWNIEWLKDGKVRGFPEDGNGGPSYGPRTASDYAFIADIVKNRIPASLLVLTEINGRTQSNGTTTSNELDRLIGLLGPEWGYRIGASGGAQRVAFLFNQTQVRADKVFEIVVAPERVKDRPNDNEPKDIFDRDPLVGRFTFLGETGTAMNDFVLVGLHLASGQHLNLNHNRAMEVLSERLRQEVTAGRLPAAEKDVFLAGDFNARRYDTSDPENFWTDYMKAEYDLETLSPPDSESYPGTRLAGVPLLPKSQIDYIMASSVVGGAFEKITRTLAHVHTELLPSDFNDFRRQASDHIPVTIQVRVVADND